MEDADSDANANFNFINCDIMRHSHMWNLHMAMPFAVHFSFKKKENKKKEKR